MQEMIRALLLMVSLLATTMPAQANDLPIKAPRPLASAIEAMKGDRWEVAAQLAARDGKAAADLIEWYRLRKGLGTPDEAVAFLRRNDHWPGLSDLRQKSEAALAGATPEQSLAFFEGASPMTGTGALALARAHLSQGRKSEAHAVLIEAWRKLDLTPEEHDAFVADFGPVLASHHDERLDMALWRGLMDVEQMLPLASPKARDLALTRRKAAREGDAGLSDAQLRDPGTAYELFNRALETTPETAIEILLRQSRISGGLGEPERWASWRAVLARKAMREGEAQSAYDLASLHQLKEGANYADLEWLAGYVALQYLKAPDLALDHFQRLRTAVTTPISLGRAGYWIGRAQEALGDSEAAAIAYGEAARYQTSFFGLLAAEKAGITLDPNLLSPEVFPPWRGAAFTRSDLHEIGTLALAMGDLGLARRFFMQLAQTLDRTGLGQMGQMLEEMGQPHLQVMLGKAAAERGITIEAPYYALHPMAKLNLGVPMEFALAIARRESEFNPDVVSEAGARGLMQLMPGTAEDMARALGLPHEPQWLLSDWTHNAKLGAAYLVKLSEKFGGNAILMAAAYNAGPRRVTQWIEEFGDPRTRNAEGVIDWIENIPFRETRNYVMRVTESLPAYRARLGKAPLPRPFSDELRKSSFTPVGE